MISWGNYRLNPARPKKPLSPTEELEKRLREYDVSKLTIEKADALLDECLALADLNTRYGRERLEGWLKANEFDYVEAFAGTCLKCHHTLTEFVELLQVALSRVSGAIVRCRTQKEENELKKCRSEYWRIQYKAEREASHFWQLHEMYK